MKVGDWNGQRLLEENLRSQPAGVRVCWKLSGFSISCSDLAARAFRCWSSSLSQRGTGPVGGRCPGWVLCVCHPRDVGGTPGPHRAPLFGARQALSPWSRLLSAGLSPPPPGAWHPAPSPLLFLPWFRIGFVAASALVGLWGRCGGRDPIAPSVWLRWGGQS